MSLDKLFQQILLTEQQLSEQTHEFKHVKVAITRCREEIRSASEEDEKTNQEVDQTAQRLSATKLQRRLTEKSEERMRKRAEELLRRKKHLGERLAEIKKESRDEEEKFLREISRFNDDFGLRGNGETASESRTLAELTDLRREAESLHGEMELMSSRNSHMISVDADKRTLLLQLRGLDDTLKELDRQLSDGEATTASLRSERLFVSQKPLADAACQRLRTELEVYKEGELERLREALSSEIQFLQSKLDSSQG
ncbi:coiled-coil domain-containing protein 172 [Brachyistius frenatus]|uniref:coiled-coil domain-containing protein 172 n=1 Tax=Brachyistius frenatus TaxID=100188 RepID=UPI0037E9AF35